MPTYTFEESIFQYFKTVAGITAICSTRIYPDWAPDGAAMPYIVFSVDEESLEETFSTPSSTMRQASVSFQCWADRESSGTAGARNLAEAVRTALNNLNAELVAGGKTVKAVTDISIGNELAQDVGYDDQRVGRTVRCTFWYLG